MTKKDDFRRVNKKGEIAGESITFLGEKYRRAKAYSRSLNECFKAAKICRSKFDYKNEAKVLLKIGFIFSKLRNI